MPDRFQRLDRIVKRGVSISKAASFEMRRAALRSINTGEAFRFGQIIPKIYREARRSIIDSYVAGFESAVPERGLNRVAKSYNLSRDGIAERFLPDFEAEIDSFLENVTANIQLRIIQYQNARISKTQIQKNLRKDFENLGLAGNSYRIEAIFNTHLSRAFNAGVWDANRLPQNAEKIWGYRYQTQKDERVRANHATMQGYTRSKNDPTWNIYAPPNGYNCRCYLQILRKKTRESTNEPAELPDEGFRFKPFVGN